MARKRFFGDPHDAKARQNLHVPCDRAPVPIQPLRQVADTGRTRLELLEQEHALLGQYMKQRLDILESDDAAGRNRRATVREPRDPAPTLKEGLD